MQNSSPTLLVSHITEKNLVISKIGGNGTDRDSYAVGLSTVMLFANRILNVVEYYIFIRL